MSPKTELRFSADYQPNFGGSEYDFDGTESRLVIINCALEDCRANFPEANRVELASYVDAYISRWEKISDGVASPEGGTET